MRCDRGFESEVLLTFDSANAAEVTPIDYLRQLKRAAGASKKKKQQKKVQEARDTSRTAVTYI